VLYVEMYPGGSCFQNSMNLMSDSRLVVRMTWLSSKRGLTVFRFYGS
jgi:hypothetical protein